MRQKGQKMNTHLCSKCFFLLSSPILLLLTEMFTDFQRFASPASTISEGELVTASAAVQIYQH